MTTFRQLLARNIGISAHVDAGKTTLTERILFYTGRIHRIGEVHDRDGRGATMDTLAAEKAHGITIRSAATRVAWRDHAITIIDTPGHADFTVEVERSLRVLDGAVFVFSAVEGVQAQSITVDRQMRRHGVPRIAFINKMDRTGANPDAVIAAIRTTLGVPALAVQVPVGVESSFEGVVDLLESRTIRFAGEHGELVSYEDVAPALAETVARARERLIDELSRHDEILLGQALEQAELSAADIRAALRRATLSHRIMPVLFGSAFHNRGVQPLLDAIVDYLPHPGEVINRATTCLHVPLGSAPGLSVDSREVELLADDGLPTVAFVFKVDETRHGALAYVRIYQGTLAHGLTLASRRTGKRVRVGRLLRLHADEPTPIDSGHAGEIVGLFGAAVESGDTLVGDDPQTGRPLDLQVAGFAVPPAVVSRTVRPQRDRDLDLLGKALSRFAREDPSLRVSLDPGSGLPLIAGTGVLQLELYAERLDDEYQLGVVLGAPRVAYRETITTELKFEHLHRKQNGGGNGQYAGVTGMLRPLAEPGLDYRFAASVRGGDLPREYFGACDRGFQDALGAGPLTKAPVVGVEVELLDGKTHSKDSSDLAFFIAARDALRKALVHAGPRLLEPVMHLEVDAPSSCFGALSGDLVRRRATILDSRVSHERVTILARVPLAEMFDYATALGSLTGGRGTHAMSPDGYELVPESITATLVERLAS
jgi:elongation factor G